MKGEANCRSFAALGMTTGSHHQQFLTTVMRPFLRRTRRSVWPLCSLLLAAPAAAQHVVKPLEYTRVVLPNGLVALFNVDHSSPIVGVGVWYHVGGKDEQNG